MVLKISLCFLALLVNIASSAEYSGLLSRLYKKAASENRPLILVLDNSLKDRDEPLKIREQSRAIKPRVDVDLDKNLPVSILDLLNQKRQPSKAQKRPVFDHPITDHKHSDLHRLKYILEKEQRERRERRERKNRAQDRDEDNLDRDDERNQNRNRDRNQDRYLEREDDRVDHRDRKRDRNQDDKRALRSSVIKNLLRTFNDLNCEAKDECQDDCNSNFNGKKKDKCEDKCEVKYECQESEKEEDPCKEKDQCDDSEEFTSTKGERLVTVTEKCKRC